MNTFAYMEKALHFETGSCIKAKGKSSTKLHNNGLHNFPLIIVDYMIIKNKIKEKKK